MKGCRIRGDLRRSRGRTFLSIFILIHHYLQPSLDILAIPKNARSHIHEKHFTYIIQRLTQQHSPITRDHSNRITIDSYLQVALE